MDFTSEKLQLQQEICIAARNMRKRTRQGIATGQSHDLLLGSLVCNIVEDRVSPQIKVAQLNTILNFSFMIMHSVTLGFLSLPVSHKIHEGRTLNNIVPLSALSALPQCLAQNIY
jgi:hypothetical protein